MTDGDKSASQLRVAVEKDLAFARLYERATFRISKSMKQFATVAIDQGVHNIVVDMQQCIGMDSTFMGVLAGLALQLKKQNRGQIYMVNLTERTRGLLSTLGLDQLVETHMAGETPMPFANELGRLTAMQPAESAQDTQHETAKMMLEAHETLVDLTPENAPRFKDVLTFLREDVERGQESG